MTSLDVNGVQVRVDVTGSGEPVVFLHGGLCSAEVMRELSQQLSGYAVHAPERPGHGRTPDHGRAFHYDDGVADTVAYLDAAGLADAHIVGFSDGAIIALLMALSHPERMRSMVAISGNLRIDVWVPEEQHAAAMPEAQGTLVEEEARRLAPEGPEHYDVVLPRILEMWSSEPSIDPASLATVPVRSLIMAGDHDMVTIDHTREIADGIPGAQLCIVPGASHMLVRERPQLLGLILQEFLDA